jgi:hypothetical protein
MKVFKADDSYLFCLKKWRQLHVAKAGGWESASHLN